MAPRRQRSIFALVIVIVLTILYLMRGEKITRNSDFYRNTRESLEEYHLQKAQAEVDAAKKHEAQARSSRLSAAEEAAKRAANEKSQRYHDSIDGKGVAGRVKISSETTTSNNLEGVATFGGKSKELPKEEGETLEDHEVEVELNAILKKSPIIIFSKSWCPHSMQAKHILIDTYNVNPAPYVVELDKHPQGRELQDRLAKITHRGTVPNILVQGRSIGGGDDIQDLHDSGKLIAKLSEMSGSRVQATLKEPTPGEMRKRRKRNVAA